MVGADWRGRRGRGRCAGAPSGGWLRSRRGRRGSLLRLAAALGADVADDVADDAVAHDDLVAAVFEDEAGAMGGGGGGVGREGFLLGGGEAREWAQRHSPARINPAAANFVGVWFVISISLTD